MDAPTPTTESTRPDPCDPQRNRRRGVMVAGLAGAVAIAGLGVPALAGAEDDPATRRPVTPEAVAVVDAEERALGDVTLDELADELAELGLEIVVGPATGSDADTETEAEHDPAAPEIEDRGDDAVDDGDPFAGMTDAEIDALSDEEFFEILERAGWTVDADGWIVPEDDAGSTDGDDHDHDHEEPSFDETAAVFSVDGDSITATSGDADAIRKAEAIWKRFTQLIPADQRQMLVGFELMAEEGAGGYVYPDDRDPTKWHMGIAPGLHADEDFVLIHEFAHLLTLQAKEVPPSLDDGSCPTYHTGEGCSLKGSTMAEFVARFWPKAQQDEVFAAQEAEDYEALDAFYQEHKDDFVTDYATTNPAEDLAETFTIFVLEDRPTGDTIADQKVQFLWNDADLVELREKIRAAL